MTTRVYIGLGSNLNDPIDQLNSAIRKLAQLPNTVLSQVSKFYRNPPVGFVNQPHFINAVAEATTSLSPEELLAALQRIELEQKRVRSQNRNRPRTIDLDILLYGNLSICSEKLTIPHPRLKDRAFVVHPLAELNPRLVLPCGTSLIELQQKIPALDLLEVNSKPIMA